MSAELPLTDHRSRAQHAADDCPGASGHGSTDERDVQALEFMVRRTSSGSYADAARAILTSRWLADRDERMRREGDAGEPTP